jgi:lipopolysaccharide biosynthesis glycosyltransferase
MLLVPPNFRIVIPCHKNDIFLTRICVASIRYYYPDIPIYLVKDNIDGSFFTKDIEWFWNVGLINLGYKKYGWTTSKLFLLVSKKLKGEKIFVLDSDTVFIGRVLDLVIKNINNYEFIISPEYVTKPGKNDFTKNIYDYKWFKKIYPNLHFPGYTFNSGNILITPGVITKKDVGKFVDFSKYPFWRDSEMHFHTRDQSILNALFSVKSIAKRFRILKIVYMLWSKDKFVQKISLDEVKSGKYSKLIHWAGEKRNPVFNGVSRKDILTFFQNVYFSKIPFGWMYSKYLRLLNL